MDNPSYNPSSRSARVQKPKVIFEQVHSVNPELLCNGPHTRSYIRDVFRAFLRELGWKSGIGDAFFSKTVFRENFDTNNITDEIDDTITSVSFEEEEGSIFDDAMMKIRI